jgi:mono/diheme cytochrome c family protein
MSAVAAILALAEAAAMTGVDNPARAHRNWMLHCQGCHRADARGSEGGAPPMADDAARFLAVEGGRDYLVRVPGVVNAGLDDAALAELMNWMLAKFDAAHMPATFAPYTAEEIADARKRPLMGDAAATRIKLRAQFDED